MITLVAWMTAGRCLGQAWLVGVLTLGLAGCVSAPAPMIENDLETFNTGVELVLKVGMPIKEARQALREKLPTPSIDTQVVAPVPSANKALQTRRYMMGWPTFTTGTTFVLTIFCDHDGRVVRWTTGPLTEER